ncbi:hypothetical protein CLV30_101118 [Haloactinopolyspora alba]|uniref:Uncharacterized protein n=2 Tax=Haloactinopolyspora alba TaxID=648780 RepID=A0A2P8EFC4_9ACTN|nr:hypothetical protein [Haloactinopolyspora alba]PSL08151.1 hypothetical protein CLV30_101118 [Haloactinopolyspora alba]
MTDNDHIPSGDEHGHDSDSGELTPEQLDALMQDTLGAAIPRPVRWAELDPADEATELVTLATWVSWLGARYGLDSRELPPDWWRHGALVEELSALKGAWDVAYDQTQAASAAADWHMTFYNTRIRLREWTSRLGGSPGNRTGTDLQRWLADPDASGWTSEFRTYLSTLTGPEQPSSPGR